jgi:HD-like signal output (HDOD) protein
MSTHNLIKREIEQDINLPVLPSGISYLLKVLNNDDIGYTELAEKLEKFPSISIKIVASANSAWASPVTPITTLRDSCARIGVQLVRSISIALTVAQVFDPTRCPTFNAKAFWVSSLLTAEAAYLCAQRNKKVCPDTARLAGLFHSIGLLWLATQRPQETATAIALKENNHDYTLSRGLTEQLGMDLYTAGGYLVSYIELPEILTKVITSPGVPASQNTDDPLINNHRHALLLASSVLAINNNNNAEVNNLDEDPCFEQLAEKLADVQSMAQALFFC